MAGIKQINPIDRNIKSIYKLSDSFLCKIENIIINPNTVKIKNRILPTSCNKFGFLQIPSLRVLHHTQSIGRAQIVQLFSLVGY
jgi:hypothetical protein